MLSSCVPERSPVTPLHTKLNQLSLTTMSHQLDQTISDAASRNLSFPQTLESLADLELEARNCRAIERRFRLSRLQAQHSIDSFNFKHHKSRAELKTRILRLLDLDFLHKGTSANLYRQSRRGQDLFGQDRWLESLQGESARAVHHGHGHAQSPAGVAGRSLANPEA